MITFYYESVIAVNSNQVSTRDSRLYCLSKRHIDINFLEISN